MADSIDGCFMKEVFSSSNPDVFLLAAEPSGDLHGSHLAKSLSARDPSLKLAGVCGPYLRSLDVLQTSQMEALQVMGFSDVAAAFPRLLKSFFQIRRDILTLNPRAVVLIDYPGFNLRLGKALRKGGYKGKLIQCICPSVWAWGKRRIPKMAQTLDLLLTLFPFEKKCFKNTSLAVEWIGHPLVKEVDTYIEDPQFFKCYGLSSQEPLLSLFPGSRKTEIQRNLPLQLKTATKLQNLDPRLQIAISAATDECLHLIQQHSRSFPIISTKNRYDLMKSSHLALATSGTVTLELALCKTPTVVHFAINSFDTFLATRILRIRLPYYCIVNILSQSFVFPELFGPQLTPQSLFQQSARLWFDLPAREECKKKCIKIHEELGGSDSWSIAADAILKNL